MSRDKSVSDVPRHHINVGETNYTEITQRPSDLAIITFITSLVPA